MKVESSGGMMWAGETEELGEKSYPSVTFSTTNPIRTDPGANPKPPL
jgi:hypothetical protein